MQIVAQIDVIEGSLGMEWNVTRAYMKKSQEDKKDTCMKFYDAFQCIYLETDASGIRLGAGFLKLRDNINCRHDQIPDNATLCQISFAS